MSDKPMIFSAPMVRALLDGRKTQTRRKLPTAHPKHPECTLIRRDVLLDPLQLWFWDGVHENVGASYPAPYASSDRLWVREGWGNRYAGEIAYKADDDVRAPIQWRSPIHMPRRLSRLTLTVTDVRVQRAQEISEADARAEGVRGDAGGPWGCEGLIEDFAALWNSIHGPDAWEANPWVAAITFTVERRNIDAEARHD